MHPIEVYRCSETDRRHSSAQGCARNLPRNVGVTVPLYTDARIRRNFVVRFILWTLMILSPLFALSQNYHWSISNPYTALLQMHKLAGVAIAFIREHSLEVPT
jgi:hypothetical protein